MQRTIQIIGIILILLLSSLSFTTIGSEEVTSTIIYVDDDGTADYTKIQDAINASYNGGTVFVYSGVYYESIVIDKSINLIGEDKNNTVINWERYSCVFISANHVYLSGFKIQMVGEDPRYSKDGITIKKGIEYIVIKGNIITNNDDGINVAYSTYNNKKSHIDIIGNDILNNRYGIRVSRPYLRITGNNFVNNSNSIAFGGHHHFIYGNSFYGPEGEIICRGYGNNLSGNRMYNRVRISISKSYDNIITNNKFYNSKIYLGDSSGNRIIGNNFSNQSIFVNVQTQYNIISKNNFYGISHITFYKYISDKTIWDNNYWSSWGGKGPVKLTGALLLPITLLGLPWFVFCITWYDFDWNPAKEPF